MVNLVLHYSTWWNNIVFWIIEYMHRRAKHVYRIEVPQPVFESIYFSTVPFEISNISLKCQLRSDLIFQILGSSLLTLYTPFVSAFRSFTSRIIFLMFHHFLKIVNYFHIRPANGFILETLGSFVTALPDLTESTSA